MVSEIPKTMKIAFTPFAVSFLNIIILISFTFIFDNSIVGNQVLIKWALIIFCGTVIIAGTDRFIQSKERKNNSEIDQNKTWKMNILWIFIVLVLPAVVFKIIAGIMAWDVGESLVITIPTIIITALKTRKSWSF